METITLILPLEEMTVNNPSNISGVTVGEIEGGIVGALAGVTAGVLIE